MAGYTALPTVNTTDSWSAANHNTYIKDNFAFCQRTPIEIEIFGPTTNTSTGDGKKNFFVPAKLNGMNLVSAIAYVITAGTTNTTDVQINNVTDGVDMLSAKMIVASGATSGAGTVDTAHDDVATGDRLRFDVDAISTTPAQGLIIVLEFSF
jgi:hypothetical protein